MKAISLTPSATICFAQHMERVMPRRRVLVLAVPAAGLVKLPVFEDNGDVCFEPGDDIQLINSDEVT